MANGTSWFAKRHAIILVLVLACYLLIELLIPLRTTIQIGGDEGFELGKATLCLKGYKLYTDVWNDQPPLHSFVITQVLMHMSRSALGPRLVTIGFALVLIASVFLIALRVHGLTMAIVASFFVILSPGFIALSASCMLEVPALSLGVAAFCILISWTSGSKYIGESFGGIVFGLSLLIKLVSLILAPLVFLLIWFRYRQFRSVLIATLVFGFSAVLAFISVDCLIEKGAFIAHFGQSWMSHFGGTHSYEYGSPADYPFDWRGLFRNWDTTIPATCGVVFVLTQSQKSISGIFPALWLIFELFIFAVHRPWWSYYYVHIAIPLSWCAAIGMQTLFQRFHARRGLLILFASFAICAATWMGARAYLQIRDIRNSPQTYNSLVLDEIKRYQPSTKWFYAEKEIYSFYSDIPMPPPLAVVMLKRLWSGEMSNARIAAEMENYKPGLILIANDARIQPFQDLLITDYRLVYEDVDFRLYTLKSIR